MRANIKSVIKIIDFQFMALFKKDQSVLAVLVKFWRPEFEKDWEPRNKIKMVFLEYFYFYIQ